MIMPSAYDKIFSIALSSAQDALLEKHLPPLRFSGTISEEILKPGSTMPRSIEDLKVGDVLDCEDGYTRTVLGVCGKVIFLTYPGEQSCSTSGYTITQIKGNGWTLHQEPEPKKRLSAVECCSLFGMTIDEAIKELKSMVE